MLKGYENYEKLNENALRTKRAVITAPLRWTFIALSHTGGENFVKLQTENTGNFLCAKIKVFVSRCSPIICL